MIKKYIVTYDYQIQIVFVFAISSIYGVRMKIVLIVKVKFFLLSFLRVIILVSFNDVDYWASNIKHILACDSIF